MLLLSLSKLLLSLSKLLLSLSKHPDADRSAKPLTAEAFGAARDLLLR
ncbi:hypothetical protein CKA32_005083 [Geitlerinema sp. FC II]|nr:hypothetical protein [Baaleninema simplex]PPT09177.1 hypothetical protein CKA32_005083 [Geitlerinema sp. FC II]